MTQHNVAGALPIGALVVAAALAVAACTSDATPSAIASAVAHVSFPPIATEAPTATPTEAPSTAATEAPSESELPSAVATDIDPCQLITSADASQLVGMKFGAGKASEAENNVKLCTYAAPGPNLFSVEVAVAPDVATAKAAEAAALQDLEDTASQLANARAQRHGAAELRAERGHGRRHAAGIEERGRHHARRPRHVPAPQHDALRLQRHLGRRGQPAVGTGDEGQGDGDPREAAVIR